MTHSDGVGASALEGKILQDNNLQQPTRHGRCTFANWKSFLCLALIYYPCYGLTCVASKHRVNVVKSHPAKKVLSAPLNTITNDVNWKSRASVTISTSPTFHSVTEAQKRIAELQSRQNKPTMQGRGSHTPGRRYVQEMQKKVSEKITTPSRAPRSAGTINIPMNKVTELKKMLNESKMKEMQRLKHAQLNAKKRAEISERVNTVRDLLKGLNGAVHHNGCVVKTSKGEELNLPRDRVSAMKAWLKEFEKTNKEHANMWNTAAIHGQGKARSHVPRTGSWNQSNNVHEHRQDDNEDTIPVAEAFADGKNVNELTEWLDDFDNEAKDLQFKKTSSIDSYENKEEEEDQCDGAWIEDTSILKRGQDERQELNMSMMPATGTSFNGEDVLDEESDWEDDYKDLMMAVDIEQINSKESWDKESVISPRDFAETATCEIQDKAKTHQVVTMVDDQDGEDESVSVEEEDIHPEFEQNHAVSIANEPESNYVEADKSYDSNLQPEEEDNVLRFNCYDSMSRISFDGHPVEEKLQHTASKNDMSKINSSLGNIDELAGEGILEKSGNDVSASFYVNRFADNSMIVNGAAGNPPPSQKLDHRQLNRNKKNRIGMFFSSLNCMKNAKTSRAAAEYTSSYEEVDHVKRVAHFPSSNSNNNSSNSNNNNKYYTTQEEEEEVYKAEDSHNAYLPALYTTENHNIPQDIAREMALQAKGKSHHMGVPQSPAGSLASAFRRQMSPDSSCVSGFTDVEACVMSRNNDIGEHVRHLQGLFRSPVRVPSRRLCQF
jgi:hypothetical protein